MLPLSSLGFPDGGTGAVQEPLASARASAPRPPPLRPAPQLRPWLGIAAPPTPGGVPKPAAQEFTRRLHGNGLSAPTPAPAGYAPNNKAHSHWLRCRLRQPISEGARAARPPAGYLESCWRCPMWFGEAWHTVVTVPEPGLRSSSRCGLERQLAVRLPAPPLVILGKRRA